VRQQGVQGRVPWAGRYMSRILRLCAKVAVCKGGTRRYMEVQGGTRRYMSRQGGTCHAKVAVCRGGGTYLAHGNVRAHCKPAENRTRVLSDSTADLPASRSCDSRRCDGSCSACSCCGGVSSPDPCPRSLEAIDVRRIRAMRPPCR
jgi:hypothetical protein